MSQTPTVKLQSVSDMKKVELQQELDEWNIIYSSKDTVPELRSAVMQSRKDRDIQTPKEPGPSHGLSGLKKMELQEMCRERGIPVGPHHTNGMLINLIKQHMSLTSTPKGTDVYNI